jgi:hypothetical protein
MPRDFYRVFLFDEKQSNVFSKGGPLYVPAEYQGEGRHDIREDGIFYCSVEPISAICEAIKRFRNLQLNDADFARPDGQTLAIAKISLRQPFLIDLREATTLVKMNFAPASITTSERTITQALSRTIFQEGVDGFLWWSALESQWTNATLYYSRVAKRLSIVEPPVMLDITNNHVIEAANILNICLE